MRPGGAADALARLGQYDVLRKLGGGGFGVVYLAKDTVSGVEVAIKTLHPLLKSNPEEMEKLKVKFALVSRLHHPNIAVPLTLYLVPDASYFDESTKQELSVFDRDFVMVMNYAPGVPLSQWRKQFPGGIVPVDKALEIMRQIASALDYAHGEKIIHRDIKPANVMVETDTQTGRIKARVLDFGLAAEIRASMSRVSQEKWSTSGTRPYMAPEQWTGKRQGAATDQYALACLFHELVSGAVPFAGVFETGDPDAMIYTVRNEEPETLEELSTDQNAALLRALSKKADERWPSCAAFVGALGGRMEGTALAIQVDTSVPQKKPPSSEREVYVAQVRLEKKLAEFRKEDVSQPELKTLLDKADEAFSAGGRALAGQRVAIATDLFQETDAIFEQIAGIQKQCQEEAVHKAIETAKALRRTGNAEGGIAALAKALELDPRNSEALSLRKELEDLLLPSLYVTAAVDGKSVAATILINGQAYAIKLRLSLGKGQRYGTFALSYRHDGKRYEGILESFRADWKGEQKVVVALKRQEIGEGTKAGDREGVSIGGVELALRWCPAGTFTMGSPETEEGRCDDETQHHVTLTQGFWLGETEVTQGLWKEVMGENPSSFKSGDDYPVESVSWNDCQDFVKKLNARYAQAGMKWALPTEAQWEYACRAGATGAFGGTGDLDEMGWGDGNSGHKTHPVGKKKANAWGLCDMHGNVCECCSDWYDDYPSGAVTDPQGPASGSDRVLRGGSWDDDARHCRSASRARFDPDIRFSLLGLRVALLSVQ